MTDHSSLMATYPPAPVTFVRGEGSRLWDGQGRSYLDFLSGLGVTSLGHSHPEVADALAQQARRLLHVSNLFGNEIGPDVARTLDRLIRLEGSSHGASIRAAGAGGVPHVPRRTATSGLSEEPAGKVFFCNSGAEANECALKLARKSGGRGRHVVLSAYGSFHGRTLATLHATGQPAKHEPFQPLPEGFRHVPFGDSVALEAAFTPEVAAVLLEVVQGEGGVNPVPAGYLAEVRRLCDERGALLIVDEVQTGLARTGEWFAFQHEGVQPDVVTMAKALGNGVPIGACWARDDVASAFVVGDHATTFGGQPLATAAAQAVLRVMEREDAPRRAEASGRLLAKGLQDLGPVQEVRGRGLLLAAELGPGADARAAATSALEAGLVVNAVSDTALRLAPSLLVSEAEIDDAVAILQKVLS